MAELQPLTMRFFRLARVEDGGSLSYGRKIDFIDLLSRVSKRSLSKRSFDHGGSTYVVETRQIEPSGLVIHKLKNASEYFSKVGNDGRIAEILAVEDDGTFADTSCVYFPPKFHNTFGIVRAGAGAPTPGRVADWLNELKPEQDHPTAGYKAVPLVNEASLDAINRGDGATRFAFEMPIENLDRIGWSLMDGATTMSEIAPGAKVKLEISYGHQRPSPSTAHDILKLVQGIIPRLSLMTKASATVVNSVPSAKKGRTKFESELVDLLDSHLAIQFSVTVSDDGVRINSTLNSMAKATATHEKSIKAAWEKSDEDTQEVVA